jgi:hypothetical protein
MIRIFAHELSKIGGSWLGTARTWLQSNVNHGDTVRWGSGDRINMSVQQFEDAAAHIAASAVNDERTRVERDGYLLRVRLGEIIS